MIRTSLAIGLMGICLGSFAEARIQCFDPATVDYGYTVDLNETRDAASVKQLGLSGPKEVAQLSCKQLPVDVLLMSPGQDLMECRLSGTVDNGLVLVIQSRGYQDWNDARLVKESFGGASLVQNLICKDLN